MSVYRLVLQTRTLSWGSEGLEWEDRRYILQELGAGGKWETKPIVSWESLTLAEQEEALLAQGYEKTAHGYWRPK